MSSSKLFRAHVVVAILLVSFGLAACRPSMSQDGVYGEEVLAQGRTPYYTYILVAETDESGHRTGNLLLSLTGLASKDSHSLQVPIHLKGVKKGMKLIVQADLPTLKFPVLFSSVTAHRISGHWFASDADILLNFEAGPMRGSGTRGAEWKKQAVGDMKRLMETCVAAPSVCIQSGLETTYQGGTPLQVELDVRSLGKDWGGLPFIGGDIVEADLVMCIVLADAQAWGEKILKDTYNKALAIHALSLFAGG